MLIAESKDIQGLIELKKLIKNCNERLSNHVGIVGNQLITTKYQNEVKVLIKSIILKQKLHQKLSKSHHFYTIFIKDDKLNSLTYSPKLDWWISTFQSR